MAEMKSKYAKAYQVHILSSPGVECKSTVEIEEAIALLISIYDPCS